MMWILFLFYFITFFSCRMNVYVLIFISSNITPLSVKLQKFGLLEMTRPAVNQHSSKGLIWKSGILWDVRKLKAGGGIGGGRHTRVVLGKPSADAAETELFDDKNSVSVSIFTDASQKDNTHSAYSELDSFLFSVALMEILQQGVSRQQTKWKKGNRSWSMGGGWEKEERGERLREQGGRRDGLDLCDLCQR